jgi:hypothetical protein
VIGEIDSTASISFSQLLDTFSPLSHPRRTNNAWENVCSSLSPEVPMAAHFPDVERYALQGVSGSPLELNQS